MTTQQDYYIKKIDNNDDHLYSIIYDSISGDPLRVKTESLDYYLSKVKRKSELRKDRIVFKGEWIPSFVKTKEQIIGSPSSSVAKRVAPQSQVKAGKRRRGRRGKRK